MRTLIVSLLIIILADSCQAQPSVNPAQVLLQPTLGTQLPLDLPFVDEGGKPTTLRACMHGKPLLLVFAWYECPMLCSEVLNGVTRSLIEIPQDAGSDFEVVTVSIDPDDTIAHAAAKRLNYVTRYGRAASWHFLTGPKPSIQALTAACGYHYAYDATTHQYAHPAGLIVVTPEGRLSRCLLGISFIANDVRLSLVDASEGRIGTLVEKLQLLCFQYDPSRNRYGLWIVGLVRALSLVTALAIGAAIWRAARGGRRVD